jgi:hypothetical protein
VKAKCDGDVGRNAGRIVVGIVQVPVQQTCKEDGAGHGAAHFERVRGGPACNGRDLIDEVMTNIRIDKPEKFEAGEGIQGLVHQAAGEQQIVCRRLTGGGM